MKLLRNIANVADVLLVVFLTLIAILVLSYSVYVIGDNFYKSNAAFSSWDLQQYKPTVKETKLGFKEISAINPDTVAWVTIDDTHIDYPVMYGSDNMDYINRDFYGKRSLSGSVYLNADNDPDFSEPYNLLYGHHMDNGAMFGDIDNFVEESYLKSHSKGMLLTPNGNFDLLVFACMKTDAYNELIYFKDYKDNIGYEKLNDFIKKNAAVYIRGSQEYPQKIIAMSTCAETGTFGRTVIFAEAIPHTASVTDENIETEQEKHIAKGHNTVTENWAVLNLVCVALTFFTFMPLIYTGRKYYQLIYAKQKKKELFKEGKTDIATDLDNFEKKIYIGIFIELSLFISSLLVFFKTEVINNNIALCDKYTYIMILLLFISLITDIVCFRYRGKRPENDFESESAVDSSAADIV